MERSVYDIALKALDGQPLDLRVFRGRKWLIVNTASECGYTAQYAQLQELHENFSGELAILGCPSNDFGNQEPGDAEQIGRLCRQRYGVSFPLSTKLRVIGPERHPLYAWLHQQRPDDGEVTWNFQKFLLDGEGKVLGVFPPSAEPLSEPVLNALGLSL